MGHNVVFIGLLLGSFLFSLGCGRSTSPGDAAAPAAHVTWVEEAIEHQGTTIALGYRDPSADGALEPVASIQRDGQPVAGAMVFTTLLSADGQPLGEEAATLYEPPGLYAPEALESSAGNSPGAVRFRIVLPDSDEDVRRDIPLP